MKQRILRTMILSFMALAVGAGVAWYQVRFEEARVTQKGEASAQKPLPVAGLKIGGPFSLTDHTGKAVTEKDYAGQYKLTYFGFTYCPAICPTELQKISQVIKALEKNEPELAVDVQPLFITVDPERDTVSVMKDYVSLFHPKMVGLTGTRPQIDFVSKAYRIFAKRVDDPEQQDYTMDHSSYVYFMGPDEKPLGIYRMDDDADYIYNDVLKFLRSHAM